MKFIATTSDKVAGIQVAEGQLIFSRDDRAIYLDTKDGRTSYQQIIYITTEAQRQGIATPLNGFYFVEETSMLWRYETSWKQVTGAPDERLVFCAQEDLPTEGKDGTLYCVGDKLYTYNTANEVYTQVGLEVWEPIE